MAALAPALQVQCGRSRDIEAFLADNVVRQLRLLSNELLMMLSIIIGLEWMPLVSWTSRWGDVVGLILLKEYCSHLRNGCRDAVGCQDEVEGHELHLVGEGNYLSEEW